MKVDPNLFRKQLKWGGITLIFYVDSCIEHNIASKHKNKISRFTSLQ